MFKRFFKNETRELIIELREMKRLAFRNALLQNCDLDTSAMVMLMQGLMAFENRDGYDE